MSPDERYAKIDEILQRITERLDRITERDDRIAERLERITERHESLAQAVELLRTFHEDEAKRNGERFVQIGRNFEVVLDSIRRLENVARSHERRISDLEGQGGTT